MGNLMSSVKAVPFVPFVPFCGYPFPLRMNERLADFVMVLHAAYAVFVVCGPAVIAAGMVGRRRPTQSRRLRGSHLAATLFVVARAWLGVPCPLTLAEDRLRSPGPGPEIAGSLREVLHRLAFRGEDPRDFTLAVTLWGGLVLSLWLLAEMHSRTDAGRHPRVVCEERNVPVVDSIDR